MKKLKMADILHILLENSQLLETKLDSMADSSKPSVPTHKLFASENGRVQPQAITSNSADVGNCFSMSVAWVLSKFFYLLLSLP